MQLPVRSRGMVLEAIVAYALDGTEPETLTAIQKAVFILVRPTLDAGRKKADNGRLGGSKPKANRKQTKREIEGEKEKEGEIEDECLRGESLDAVRFDSFWQSYPKKVGKKAAWEVWKSLDVDEALHGRIMESLNAWKSSKQWCDEGGRFIPFGAKWLRERYFDAPPEVEQLTGAQGYLGQAELEAIEQVLGN